MIIKAITPRVGDNLQTLIKELPNTPLNRGLAWNISFHDYFVELPKDAPKEAFDLLNELIKKAEA